MARRGSGGGGTQDPRILEEALAAQAAGTALTQAQTRAIAEELAIKREGLGIERGKLELGGKELTSKDKQAQLQAAINTLELGGRERTAAETGKTNVLSDMLRIPGMTTETAAQTLAAGGRPELYNALAVEKARQREAAVRQAAALPQMTQAKSPAEREKIIKGPLEARFPGAYPDAVALAYPKTAGGYVPTFEPQLYKAPAGPAVEGAGDRYAGLAERLLGAAGFGGGAGGGGGYAPQSRSDLATAEHAATLRTLAANPRAYADPSVGALEGSQRHDLAGGLSELTTPSGGTIRFKTPANKRAENTLARFITPAAERQQVATVPRMDIPLVAPPGLPPLDQLLATNQPAMNAPTPTPTPAVPPPVPSVTPAARPPTSPIPVEMLAELARRAEEERRRREALMAQNQQ